MNEKTAGTATLLTINKEAYVLATVNEHQSGNRTKRIRCPHIDTGYVGAKKCKLSSQKRTGTNAPHPVANLAGCTHRKKRQRTWPQIHEIWQRIWPKRKYRNNNGVDGNIQVVRQSESKTPYCNGRTLHKINKQQKEVNYMRRAKTSLGEQMCASIAEPSGSGW